MTVQCLHSREPFWKGVFPSDFIAAGEMVDPLESAKIAVNIWFNDRWAPYKHALVICQE